MAIQIKPATVREAYWLYALNEEANGANATTPERMQQRLRTPGNEHILLAFVDSQPAGFICVQLWRSACRFSSWGEICDIYLQEAYRGQGIGALLLRSAESLLRDLEAYTVILRLSQRNHPAQDFFESQGYFRDQDACYRRDL